MATVTLSSARNTTISQTLPHENNTMHLRNASFSSYLSNSEEAFMLKLGESMRKPSAIITTNPQEPLYQISFGRKETEDGEISVFGAEKYFNGGMNHKEESRITVKARPKHHQIKEDDHTVNNMHTLKPRTKLGTPSTCSEVSWNSQTALLPAPLKDPSPRGRIKVNSRNFFATLGCKCYCSDDKSIDIEENVVKNIDDEVLHGKPTDPIGLVQIKQNQKQPRFKEERPSKNFEDVDVNMLKEDCFTFPTSSNSEVGNVSFKRQFVEEARRTLELFGSPIDDKEDEEDVDIALSLEKKLSMLTWDATPIADDTPVATPNKEGLSNSGDCGTDDIESDSSSDLFEIKSFSSNPNPFFRRQPSEGVSGCMTPSSTCYEPSEASIEWSVVTASAANFSVASDYDDPKSVAFATTPKALHTNIAKSKTNIATKAMGKEVPKRLPSMLSGCRSHKAVKVVGEAHEIPVKAKLEARIHRPESFVQMAKFPLVDTKVKDFESANMQLPFGAHGFAQLCSAIPGSDSLYIR